MSERIEPPTSELTDPFWDATRERTYLVQWCTACDEPIFYPREVCPRCLTADTLAWRPSSGRGTVYAVSVQHRPASPGLADRVPYVVALVDLDAGAGGGDEADGSGTGARTIRVMSNVVGEAALDVRVGDPVVLTWEALTDGRNLPQFERP